MQQLTVAVENTQINPVPIQGVAASAPANPQSYTMNQQGWGGNSQYLSYVQAKLDNTIPSNTGSNIETDTERMKNEIRNKVISFFEKW